MIYFLSVVCVWGVSQWLWIQKETQLKWRQSFVYELEFKKSFPKPFSQSSYRKSTWWIGRVFPPFTGEHTAWRFTQSLQLFSVEDLGLGTVPLASKLGFLIFSARPCALWLFIFIFIILHTLFAVCDWGAVALSIWRALRNVPPQLFAQIRHGSSTPGNYTLSSKCRPQGTEQTVPVCHLLLLLQQTQLDSHICNPD